MMVTRGELLEQIAELALSNDMNHVGCSQSVLHAIQTKLGLDDPGAFKAASALSGGVARRGETCGALIGGIMATSLIVGRDRIEDTQQYRSAMIPATEMYFRFQEAIGHTICSEIHRLLFGRSFKLYEEEDYKAFLAAGGHEPEGCPGVCGKAARIAADIVLDLMAQHGYATPC